MDKFSNMTNDKLIRLAFTATYSATPAATNTLQYELAKRLDMILTAVNKVHQPIIEVDNNHDSPQFKAWLAQDTTYQSLVDKIKALELENSMLSEIIGDSGCDVSELLEIKAGKT